MRTIRFNNNRHISSSPLLRTEGGREASVSNTSGDKIPKGKFSPLISPSLLPFVSGELQQRLPRQ